MEQFYTLLASACEGPLSRKLEQWMRSDAGKLICTEAIHKIARLIHGPMRMIDYGDRFDGRWVLTFDDGPNENTINVLEALKLGEVHSATFFVQGVHAKKYPWILRRIVQDGHTLANHTYNHVRLAELSCKQIVRQLQMCQDAVNDALGRRYDLKQMRPPFGSIDDRVLTVLHALNLDVLFWQADPKDYLLENQRDPYHLAHSFFERTIRFGSGGLILFHDIHKTTAELVLAIIKLFDVNGMKFTDVKSLIAAKYPNKYFALSSLFNTSNKNFMAGVS
jgi:peptidoglycan/xylan/chitin deacetylase (PgdA/CDA1 family)